MKIKGEITKEESCTVRHVVCISNNLEQTGPFQQKTVFLLFAVFKTNSVPDIVLPWQQEPDKHLFQFLFKKIFLTTHSTNKTLISLLHVRQWLQR